MHFNWEKIGIKSKIENDKLYIFDPFRKKFVVATPEEEVRQYTLYTLCEHLNYPRNSISVERQIQYNQLKKRFDILVYDGTTPSILIECKAAFIDLNQAVFHQLCQYNFVLKVPFLMITNGKSAICAQIDFENKTYKFIEELPMFGKTN